MADWVRCTTTDGDPIFVNISTAMSAFWDEREEHTIVAYAGGGEDLLRVKEKPDEILKTGNIDFG